MGKHRRLVDLCDTRDVVEGQALKVEAEGLTVAVFNASGDFYVLDDHCTHGPGSLSQGWLTGHEIMCEFHQGCFDVRTGEVTQPPPMLPARTYEVMIVDGRVKILL